MSKKILFTYATSSGSTKELAEKAGKIFQENGYQVDVIQLNRDVNLDEYDSIIIGAPMIVGWHRNAMKLLSQYKDILKQKSVAIFMTCLNLPTSSVTDINGIQLTIDTDLAKSPQNPDQLNFKEKHTLPESYAMNVLGKFSEIKPIHIGIFGGKLDYNKLKLIPRLFVKFLIRGVEGDYRNWKLLETWSEQLSKQLN